LSNGAADDFEFSTRPRRTLAAFGASLLLQTSVLAALYFTGRVGLQVVGVLPTPTESLNFDLTFLRQPGLGGGGGGGGNRMPEPPRKAEAQGQDRMTVPAALTPTFEAKREPPPLAQVIIPVQNLSQGLQDSLGVAQSPGPPTSRGPGSGLGVGAGDGDGIGPGRGPGLGPGSTRGTGGDDYGPGSGATDPIVTRRVDPKYTPEAMLAHLQGSVWVTCIVRPNGICTDARVTRAPDPPYGLDRAALEAVGQWRFVPGRKGNQPVSVPVSIQLDFSVR